ncbi:hypothetical protein JSR06_00220 [Candidatus Vidania fulgoroideae]|uniref:Glutamyl/glutaminyl-tRNA synthetase class Ib catalytic domain-containing protein n=1 Tax=Candidatus Vidania fulgoroideorum TaxID=881286 RepID=A0A975AEL5_9PROT|nr:hypothetical protein JSR06_00220 [Candidatus Vidania fulgoroideae]
MKNFITKIIENSNEIVKTRFCPEPGGFLHIGHIKNFILNYKLSTIYKGKINIRMDDSNPIKSKHIYSKRIYYEILSLGFNSKIKLSYSSDYFKRIYYISKAFIKKDLFYIDNMISKRVTSNIKINEKTIYKQREKKEKLYLIKKMRNGLFKEKEFVVRANITKHKGLIDPIVFRILKRLSKGVSIYPTYDLCNSISDRIEKITFSICTNEFINNKEIYNWLVSNYNKTFKKKLVPIQIEFSRMKIEGVTLGKRNIRNLIRMGIVKNWSDPRLYTVKGLINRGISNKSIKEIALSTGYTRSNYVIKECFIRRILIRNLSKEVKRKTIVILKPVKVIVINLRDKKELFVESVRNIKCLYSFFLKKKLYNIFFLRKKPKCCVFLYFDIKIKMVCSNCITKINSNKAMLYTYLGNSIKKTICIIKNNNNIGINRAKFRLKGLGYFYIYRNRSFIVCKEIVLFSKSIL